MAIREGANPYQAAAAWVRAYRLGDPLLNYYYYPPTYAALLVPLTFLPFERAVSLWGLCIAGFLVVSVYALLRIGGSRPSLVGLLTLVTAASLTTAVREELFLGQANLFMLACVCGGLWAHLQRRTWLAAVLLGLAFTTKPMLLILLVFLLWKREFALVSRALVATLGLFLVPFMRLGVGALGDLTVLWNFWSTKYIAFNENLAPRGLLERLLNVNPVAVPVMVAPWLAIALWLVTALIVSCLCLAVVAPRPLKPGPRSLVELGTIVSAVLLVSPLIEAPYLVFLLVPWIAAVLYLRQLGWERPAVRWSAAALVGLWMLLLIGHRPTPGWTPDAAPVSWMLAVMATVAPALLIMVATFTLQLELSRLASGRRTQEEVSRLLRDSPRLAVEWLRDFRAWAETSVRALVG
ncbi:MAG: DUF2029 domain-containing protein [Chloroflexi bacterium]|nr:DUF2029 domain-containing protein [Chloroflexota bacterium]